MYKNRIYLSKIDLSLNHDTYNSLLQAISKENRERCRRFKFMEDALRTLYGELILRHVLIQHFSSNNEGIKILKGESGKPYVSGVPIHFNISHSGDFVVCAISEQSIGIDIEKIVEVDLTLATRYFCRCEYDDLLAQDKNNRHDYFFSLWTLKESYIKWLGGGMSIPLDSFYFKIADDGISMTDTHRKTKPYFKQFYIDGYKLSLCSMFANFPDKIQKISIEEMEYIAGRN